MIKTVYSRQIIHNDKVEKFSIESTKDNEYIVTMRARNDREVSILLSWRELESLEQAIFHSIKETLGEQ